MNTENKSNNGPLSGLRIIDSTTMVAMPTALHIMADMGAEVIKIETHTMFRLEGSGLYYADNDPGDEPWNRDGSFNALNRSKLSLTLDLKTPEGVKVFKDIARISDVIVENNRAGTMDRLGLSYDHLIKEKPDLIYVSNTGFGHTGPWKTYAGIGRMFELTCGLSQFTGYPDQGPRRVGSSFFDLHAGWAAVFAILTALHFRRKTGKGQWVDLSMYQIGTATLGNAILDFEVNGRNGTLMGNRHELYAPHGVYRCKGPDEWIAIGIEDDQQWLSLCKVMGNPHWMKFERFKEPLARWHHQDELDRRLTLWTSLFNHIELMDLLQQVGVPAAAVMNSRDAMNNSHMRVRKVYERIAHHPSTGIGFKSYFGRSWKMSRSSSYIRRPAPLLGEHNQQILSDLLGRPEDEIERLYHKGVIATVPIDHPSFTPPSYKQQISGGTLVEYDSDYTNTPGAE